MTRPTVRLHSGDRPARLPREERREHFLDVAAQIILERGVDAVTMENVAAAAGVSKGLGYAYFENRNDLLLALLEREITAHEKRVGKRMAEAETLEDRVRAGVRAWFDTMQERGELLNRLLQASQLQSKLEPRRNSYQRRLEEVFGKMATDELGIPRRRAVIAASILLAGLNGVFERWMHAGDPQELLEDTYVQVTMGAVHALANGSAP